jgi:hypothetical protein
MMEGEKVITSKRIFKVEVFFSSQNTDFPFYLSRLLELPPPLFFFFTFFYASSLEDLGVLMIFEEKITSLKTFFQMARHGMAWS